MLKDAEDRLLDRQIAKSFNAFRALGNSTGLGLALVAHSEEASSSQQSQLALQRARKCFRCSDTSFLSKHGEGEVSISEAILMSDDADKSKESHVSEFNSSDKMMPGHLIRTLHLSSFEESSFSHKHISATRTQPAIMIIYFLLLSLALIRTHSSE